VPGVERLSPLFAAIGIAEHTGDNRHRLRRGYRRSGQTLRADLRAAADG
jgi:hypothetical protein